MSITRAFHQKRCTRKFRLKQKRDFLLKIVYLAIGVTTFAENVSTRWNLGILAKHIHSAKSGMTYDNQNINRLCDKTTIPTKRRQQIKSNSVHLIGFKSPLCTSLVSNEETRRENLSISLSFAYLFIKAVNNVFLCSSPVK